MSNEKSAKAVRNETDEKIARMEAEINRLKTNPHNYSVKTICNVCGDEVTDRCPRHPDDKTNHVREATDVEKGERRGDFVLVKQT